MLNQAISRRSKRIFNALVNCALLNDLHAAPSLHTAPRVLPKTEKTISTHALPVALALYSSSVRAGKSSIANALPSLFHPSRY